MPSMARMLSVAAADRILAERELVEQHRPLPADLAQRPQELEGLHRMDGADDHVVVPLAQVVVDLDAHQPAATVDELEHVGGRLLGEQRVAHVQHDAQVVGADLLDAQERPGRGAEGHVDARLLELVLDRELQLGGGLDDLAHAVELEVPECARGRPGTG